MYCTRKVTQDLIWVGADARRVAMFEGVYGVPDGISYNSYLLQDEKTVLFDAVDKEVADRFFDNVKHALAGRELDYLVVHHMEPDHAATLRELVLHYPSVKILCSAMAKTMLRNFFDEEMEARATVVKEGDTLSVGRHTLRFVMAPMVHWPEVMMSYEETEGILFSADAFGGFGALNGRLFADEVDFLRDHVNEYRRYYTNIVGKYGGQTQAVLKKMAELPVRMICPLHGFVWRKDLELLIGKHERWSRYEPEEKGVLLAYASIYGHTETAANLLACYLAEEGVPVRMYDTSVTPASYIVSDAFRMSHLVFASSSYNAGVFVSMEALLHDIAAHGLRNRRVALIENGSWAPTAKREMERILEPLKEMSYVAEPITIRSSATEEQRAALQQLAKTIAGEIR